MKDRLIEILDSYYAESGSHFVYYFTEEESEMLADYLFKNGVIAPPCKVGDVLYYIDIADVHRPIKEKLCVEIQYGYGVAACVCQDEGTKLRRAYNFGDFGKIIFLSCEEAVRVLRENKYSDVVEQLNAEIESSDKYIREYDDSEVQKAYNQGLRHALKIVTEMGVNNND